MTIPPWGPHELPDHTDVLVVGAGPTGLSLAAALAARDVDVVVVDGAPEGGTTSRAAVIHARTLEVLEDIDVTPELLRRGLVVSRFVVKDRDATLLTIPFDTLDTAYPFTLMLPQDETEQVLAERLTALGEPVYRERTVTDLDADRDGVTIHIASPRGPMTSVRARYVVGCDGMHSVIREQCGIAFEGDRYPQSFALADVEMSWPLAREEIHLFFSPGGLVVVAPLPHDRYRIVATLDEAPEHPDVADVQALLDQRGPIRPPAMVARVLWGSRFRVHHRLAASYRCGRIFLAGDAAHVHSPAGGQGMNTGIQDAMALAPLLAGALTSGDSAELDAYEAVRRPVAQHVIVTTDRLTRAANLRNPVLRHVRNAAFRTLDHVDRAKRNLALDLSELATGIPTQVVPPRMERRV